jgi:protoporphyrinogen oxidase
VSEAVEHLVIGAGVTGLTAACHLPGESTLVLEAEDEVGGNCRSTAAEGYRFDRAGHFLHLRDEHARAFIHGLLPDSFVTHARRAAIHVSGSYVPHPLQAHLGWLPTPLLHECLRGFRDVQRRAPSEPPETAPNLHEWFRRTFGEGITRHFLGPQNRKTYCCDLTELDRKWALSYVPRPSATEVEQGARAGAKPNPLGYNAEFLYPVEGGIGLLPRTMASKLANVRCGKQVVAVDSARRRVTCADGSVHAYRKLVSTMPLKTLVGTTSGLPADVVAAAGCLRSVDVLDIRLGIACPAAMPYHWIYFPESRFPFTRVVIPSNVSPSAAPPGHCAIHLEVNRPTDAPVDAEALVADGIGAICSLGIVQKDARVVTSSVDRIRCAYVLHDHERERYLPRIQLALHERDIHSVGRYGAWGYGGIERAVLDGIEVARRLRDRQSPAFASSDAHGS